MEPRLEYHLEVIVAEWGLVLKGGEGKRVDRREGHCRLLEQHVQTPRC